MTLDSLQKGRSAIITAIKAEKELKNRFSSFGIIKGVVIHAEQYSLARQTMEIRINNTRIALRLSEAEKVEISQ